MGRALNLLTARLQKIGGRVSTQELAYQMQRHHGLVLSEDEIGNQLAAEERAGRVESFVYYRACPNGKVRK